MIWALKSLSIIDSSTHSISWPLADQAKTLEDQGLLIKDIADRLQVNRNRVTKALKRWYSRQGLEQPDGRTRRTTLSVKQSELPVYKEIADEAKRLSDEGVSDVQIAAQLNCSAPTVVNAIAHWYSERGLPVPDRAQRHRECVEKIKSLYDQGMLLKDIATVVKFSSRSVTLMLQEWFESRGLKMPDARSRRHSAAKLTDGTKSSTEPTQQPRLRTNRFGV
jgi:transposase